MCLVRDKILTPATEICSSSGNQAQCFQKHLLPYDWNKKQLYTVSVLNFSGLRALTVPLMLAAGCRANLDHSCKLPGVYELQITIETRRIHGPLDQIKHTVAEIDQTVGRGNSFAGALLRYSFKDLQMAICRLAQPLIWGGPGVINPADAA